MNNQRRQACILLVAARGDLNAARGLVGRAIRSELKVRRWHAAPHFVHYEPAGEGGAARYLLSATDAEVERVSQAVLAAAPGEGWDGAPIDVYHD